IAAQLKEVGIALEVRPYEWGTFFRDIKTGNFQMYSSTWVGVTEPDIYYYAFASSQFPPKGANRGFYSNPELDKLLEAGRVSTVTSTRKEIYSQVQKIISHDLPYVSLWYEDNVVFTRPQVEGYSLRPDASLLGLTRTKLEAKPPTTVTDAQLRL
ncbi:ABC transporter substrate-binding protein, partial [bacterium]